MEEPSGDLQVTDTFNRALDKVKAKIKIILYCYGVAGSGKSQLVQSLAVKFPYTATLNDSSSNSPTIKWHIQCKDTEDDLKKQFLKLAEELAENGYRKDINLKSLKENFRKNQTKMFSKILVHCNIPVLIIIEDPTEAGRVLIQNFFQSLRQYFLSTNQHIQTKFHVYITSRSKSSIAGTQSMPPIEYFENRGFSEEEAIIFLQDRDGATADTRDNLVRVFKRFSGLPLGLLAARSFCKRSFINYQQYLQLVDSSCYDYTMLSDELEAVLKECGKSGEHVFQAILMPFFPCKDAVSGESNLIFRKILCCISYFDYDRIPRFLLEYCCHLNCESQEGLAEIRNTIIVGQLSSKLLDYDMCKRITDGTLIFHEVVLNAFRLMQQFVPSFNSLKKSIETMSGLVSRDLRRKENFERMRKLLPHIQALLKHIEKNFDTLKKDDDFEMLKAVISHLYQAVGALLLGEAKEDESDAMFHKSLGTIWPEMADVALLQTRSNEEIASKVIEKSKQKALNLPEDFIIKYSSWIMLSHFDEDEVAFLKSESQGNFEEVVSFLLPLTSKILLVEKLQKCKLFLTDEEYRPIFFAERFASILHSWSRCFLFRDQNQAMQHKCLWMNTLSKSVSDGAHKSSTSKPRIRLLTQWLSQIAGLIPFLLKQKDKPEHLQRAQELCEEMISNEELKMYENGLLKKAFSPPVLTRSSLLRYIVRINARLVKSSNQTFLHADEQCKQLLQLVRENVKASNYIGFIIYCAKYHAAKNDFAQAKKCFKVYFDLTSKQKSKTKFSTDFWATYNYARAVNANDEALSLDKEEAIQRCNDVLSSDKVSQIQEDLKHKLKIELNKLLFSKNS